MFGNAPTRAHAQPAWLWASADVCRIWVLARRAFSTVATPNRVSDADPAQSAPLCRTTLGDRHRLIANLRTPLLRKDASYV